MMEGFGGDWDTECGVLSSDGIIAAVMYSEGGAGSDAVRYSIDGALNGRLLAVLYVEDSSAVA